MLTKKPELNNKENIIVSVSIVKDKEIQELNKKYFKRDYPTDVLSFSMDEEIDSSAVQLGDIIVNRDQAERQASEYGNTTEEEIAELVGHGVLHLLGVHHEDDNEHSVHGVPVMEE